jgi:hypothetical protein
MKGDSWFDDDADPGSNSENEEKETGRTKAIFFTWS